MADQADIAVKYLKEADAFEVSGLLTWSASGMPVVHEPGSMMLGERVSMVFRRMNNGYWKFIERSITEHKFHNITKQDIYVYNFSKMKGLVLKFFLRSWTLPITLSFDEHGLLDSDSYDRVMDVHPNILRYFIDHVEKLFFLTDEDRETITKQSLRLFGGSNTGVMNPHEAISMYCDLSQFWEKFGLNFFDIQLLPQDVYTRLKTVIANEIDITSQKLKNDSKSRSHASRPRGKMLDHVRF